MDKYKEDDVISQLANVIESFKTVGIEIPADAEPEKEKTEEEKKAEEEAKAKEEMGAAADMEGGECEYDGGDEEEKPAEDKPAEDTGGMAAAAVTDPRTASTDTETYAGFANVPGCFLRNALVNPFFGDLVKSHVVHWEMFGDKASEKTWGGVAGLLTSGIASAARADSEAWFSGYVGELDQESLMGMANNGAILFPGWTEGWANADDATNYLKTLEASSNSKGSIKRVVFHVTNASTLTVLGNRSVSHRLQGTVTKMELIDGVTHLEVTGLPHDD